MDDAKELAHQKRVYLADWLEGAKSIQAAVPNVQRQLDLAAWDEQALSDAPREVEDVICGSVAPLLEQDLETIHKALPELPRVELRQVYVSDATTSTSSMVIYHLASVAQSSHDSQIETWGYRHCKRYETLQGELGRETEVRGLLYTLKDKLGHEFDDAVSAYRMAQAGIGIQPNVGIAMRNVLEHYKGELMTRACDPNEQKVTWEQMADRLVTNPGVPRQRFLLQEKVWETLHARLTGIAKNRGQLDLPGLKTIFVEFVDHLYVTLSLAK